MTVASNEENRARGDDVFVLVKKWSTDFQGSVCTGAM